MTTALYNEKEPHAAAWLRNLIGSGELPDGEVDERSIVDLCGDDLAANECHFFAGIGIWARAVADAERAGGRRLPRPVFTGSAPCQPLSVAGQRQGDVDQRHLWPAFYRLIDQRRPATILGEQVAGADGREWMAAVRADLEALGYAVGVACLPAAGLGAPHLRYRLFWVAYAERQPVRREGRDDDGEAGADAGEVGQQRLRPDNGAGGAAGGLADAIADGRQGRLSRRPDQERGVVDRPAGCHGPAGGSGPPHGFWDDADWIFCRDGKWRPVEPGSFPLVDGAAFKLGSGGAFEGMSRTGMLRGYGNAVVLPAATAFIEAAMEALDGH